MRTGRTALLRNERLAVPLRELDLVGAGLLAVVMDARRLLAAPVEVDERGDADRQDGDRKSHDDRPAHEGEGHRHERDGEGGYDDRKSGHAYGVPTPGRGKRLASTTSKALPGTRRSV